MKYKNSEIGIPTLEIVEECCKTLGLAVPASDVYNHYKKKNFLTKKKLPIKTVEAMCSAHNSVYLNNLRKNTRPSDPFYKDIDKDTKELAMAEKYIAKHINRFCESMKIVMAHDMAKFGKLLSDLRTSLTK